jgi:hypothetical protein
MTPYQDYLDSPEWWQQRRFALARARYHCERCGCHRNLEVHHHSYDRLGFESSADLEVLCDPCHHAEHLPRNRSLRIRERLGQQRLFDRWTEAVADTAVPILGAKYRRSA